MAILKAAFVGCGGIANNKHLPALKHIPEVECVAFCDIIPERAERTAKEYGTPDAKVYTDYQEMITSHPEVDIVYVCTPNRSHAEISIFALDAKKHVMCEKPMAICGEEARAMCEAVKRNGKKLTVGYQNRQLGSSLWLKKACEADELGEIYFAKAHALRRRAVPTWGVFLDAYNQGGGPLIDIGTHALDMTLWMMNNYRPKYAVGTTFRKLADQKETGNAWGDWDPEEFTVEDSAFGFVVMENGATIILESSWALNTEDEGEAQTTLCGVKAGATTHKGGVRVNGVKFGKKYTEIPEFAAAGVDYFDGATADPSVLEQRQWIDALLQEKDPCVLPEQACVVTEILEAIYESAKTGQPVYFNK